MEGWVKLHRKFNNWEWKDSPKHVALFLHLLLNANHKDNSWKGIMVSKGSLITGRKALSIGTGISERSIRTILKDLKSTNEVTIEPTRKFSIITITNWDEYQVTDRVSDQQVTNRRPATDHQTTTNKNVKNDKNEKNKIKAPSKKAPSELDLKITEIGTLWNRMAEQVGLPSIMPNTIELSGKRRAKLKIAILVMPNIEDWKDALRQVPQSPFNRGENTSNWRAHLDWLIAPQKQLYLSYSEQYKSEKESTA